MNPFEASFREANYRAFAACCATVIAFIGTLDEVAGGLLFTWAPGFFGPIFWHVVGLAAVAICLLLLFGCLRLIRVPIAPLALATSLFCLLAVVLIAVGHRQFHFFALCGAIAGVGATVFYRKAEQLRNTTTTARP